jgi:hypothetical protein
MTARSIAKAQSRVSNVTSRQKRAAQVPWIRAWVLSVAAFAVSIASIEAFWRAHGQRVHVTDSNALWVYHRGCVYEPHGKVIVLLGASRMQADISVPVLRQRFPDYRVVQLAASGRGSALAVLDDLARDTRFRGTVLFDMIPPYIARQREGDQATYVQYRCSASEKVTATLKALVQGTLVCVKPAVSLRAFASGIFKPEMFPAPQPQSRSFDRSLFLDFQGDNNLVEIRKLMYEQYRVVYSIYFDEAVKRNFDSDTELVDNLVRQIQGRGGNVVFVSLPVSGSRAELEEQQHPRKQYWDRFSQRIHGVCVHAADLRPPKTLVCPDESHLDGRDAPIFTSCLCDYLCERRVFCDH